MPDRGIVMSMAKRCRRNLVIFMADGLRVRLLELLKEVLVLGDGER